MEEMADSEERNRLQKLALGLNQSASNVNEVAELKESMQSLDKLKSNELKIWWDYNMLKMYYQRNMIP